MDAILILGSVLIFSINNEWIDSYRKTLNQPQWTCIMNDKYIVQVIHFININLSNDERDLGWKLRKITSRSRAKQLREAHSWIKM